MGDNILLNGRTRSKSTLPETSVEFSRSPFKDARQKNRRTETEGKGKAAEEGNEDELNLSPKRELRLGDKRSPSPSPSGERPRSKRLKPSHIGNDIENNTASSHSRHRSDSYIPPQSDRKRSATPSTPKSMSNSSTRLQSPALEKKERARSVPLFPSFRDFPTIDIRDIPASPTRRFPPKLRIASFTSVQKLQSIPEPVQASVLTDVLPAEIATPIQDAFRVDYPMSPLTPLPEASPFKIPADATGSPEDRFIGAGWGQVMCFHPFRYSFDSRSYLYLGSVTGRYPQSCQRAFVHRIQCHRQPCSAAKSSASAHECSRIFFESQINFERASAQSGSWKIIDSAKAQEKCLRLDDAQP